MRTLSDTAGYFGFGETSSEDGYSESSSERKRQFKELIAKANGFSLKEIFKSYNVSIDQYSRRCSCPFHSRHKNGRDGTPSFHYYPNTNTFHCFGCKSGRGPVDFVSIIENISTAEAAKKILDIYGGSDTPTINQVADISDYSERYSMIIDFSDFVREFYRHNTNNQEAIDFMDKICNAFDSICSKHTMSNDSIKSLIEKLKAKTEKYNQCHRY
jgi:DNA primase